MASASTLGTKVRAREVFATREHNQYLERLGFKSCIVGSCNFNWSSNESLWLCIVRVSPAFGRILADFKAENSGSSDSRTGIGHGLVPQRAQHSSTKEYDYDVFYRRPETLRP